LRHLRDERAFVGTRGTFGRSIHSPSRGQQQASNLMLEFIEPVYLVLGAAILFCGFMIAAMDDDPMGTL